MSQRMLEEKITSLIAPAVAAMGFGIVRVKLGEGNHGTLQVMAERPDTGTLSLDDCAAISETISALLDVEDPIAGEYTLEVSSPGIDRPLVKLEDFEKFAGREIKLATDLPVNGRKRYKGKLLGLTEDREGIRLQLDDSRDICTIPYPAIESAKLLLTDELLAAGRF